MVQIIKESHNLLLIFTRNPELGKCKTRLAATIGDDSALAIYKFLLQHTVLFSSKVNAQKEVYYSENIWQEDIWDNSIFNKKLQEGKDLGNRMHSAFKNGFKSGYKKIIIIGSDMYDLTTSDINNAFQLLNEYDYVVGPAEDGGYYLLGMTVDTAELFVNKEWGTNTVFKETLNNLKNKKATLLPIKNDVDLYEDIKDIEVFQPFLKNINP